MSKIPGTHATRAFSRTDFLAVMAILCLLALLCGRALGVVDPASQRAACANNLRQLGAATSKFANEHDKQLPMGVPPAKGGSAGQMQLYQHLMTLSNYVASPQIMVCPTDTEKRPAADFSNRTNGMGALGNLAAGYAMPTEVLYESPRCLLWTDRFIQMAGTGTCSGPLGAFPFIPVGKFRANGYWFPASHAYGIGNLSFMDGSVRTVDTQGLRKAYTVENPFDGNWSGCTMMP